MVETETFYFSQPFTKNITLDLSNYVNAFSQYSSLIPEFAEHLKVYSNHDLINKTEPKPLIPFSADLNFYKIEEDTLGSNAFNACSINGGALIAIDGQNRQQIANILKASGISKTPFYALPFHSLFSPLSLETFDTPSRDNLQQMWLKSPPYLTSENQILYPSNKIKITKEMNETPHLMIINLLFCVRRKIIHGTYLQIEKIGLLLFPKLNLQFHYSRK